MPHNDVDDTARPTGQRNPCLTITATRHNFMRDSNNTALYIEQEGRFHSLDPKVGVVRARILFSVAPKSTGHNCRVRVCIFNAEELEWTEITDYGGHMVRLVCDVRDQVASRPHPHEAVERAHAAGMFGSGTIGLPKSDSAVYRIGMLVYGIQTRVQDAMAQDSIALAGPDLDKAWQELIGFMRVD